MKKKNFKNAKKDLLVSVTKIRELSTEDLPAVAGGRQDCNTTHMMTTLG